MEFKEWPKTARLVPREGKPVVITEKIDGANVGVHIEQHLVGTFDQCRGLIKSMGLPVEATDLAHVLGVVPNGEFEYWTGAQSRSRLITLDQDVHGFGRWVQSNSASLTADLGEGLHMGEWWGQGINRGYGLTEKRLSLFNTRKWSTVEFSTPGLGVVPVLRTVESTFWGASTVFEAEKLGTTGSVAAPGFDRPEGVCAYHPQADAVFKYTLDGDGHKGVRI